MSALCLLVLQLRTYRCNAADDATGQKWTMTAQFFSSKIGRRPSNQLSYKPPNQTEKWYGRRERRDNKSNAEAGIKNTSMAGGECMGSTLSAVSFCRKQCVATQFKLSSRNKHR
jgi:hypothetical protein